MTGVWEAMHAERLAQLHGTGAPDPAAFRRFASDQASQKLAELIAAGRGDVPVTLVDSEFWPQVDLAPDGSEADVADCVLVETRPAGRPDADAVVRSQVWTGTAAATPQGWRIGDVAVGVDNCVPPALARQLVEAYGAYHHAWTTAWDPPDPDHPLLAQTMAGQRLDGIRKLLEADLEAGIVFRDPHPLDNAVVFDLGIGEATVSDCHPAHPDYGAYDAETGARLAQVVAPTEPDQLNLTSVDLIRTDNGDWKVIEAGGLDDANCDPGGTAYVVAP